MLLVSSAVEGGMHLGWDVAKWGRERPSIAGYDIVVLDLLLGADAVVQTDGCARFPGVFNFYQLGDEVANCLRAGGTVIALLGPVAVTSGEAQVHYHGETLLDLRRSFIYPYKYVGDRETSYDWLDQGFLRTTRIDSGFSRRSCGIKATPGKFDTGAIAGNDKPYWVSIDGIVADPKHKGSHSIDYGVAQEGRWRTSIWLRSRAVVLARGAHSGLTVAAAVQYMGWDGILVLLPAVEPEVLVAQLPVEGNAGYLQSLRDLGKGLREYFRTSEAFDHEEWVLKHRPPKVLKIDSDIQELRREATELEKQLEPLNRMLSLLDGTGGALVDALANLFDRPAQGMDVKRTEKGAPFDLVVWHEGSRCLVIEATGIRGTLSKDDKHWSSFLGYLQTHYANNAVQRVERMVFVVNTECDKEVDRRDRTRDITGDVKAIVERNEICVVRSCDLYQLWLDSLNGGPIVEIFDRLFHCGGVFSL